MAKKLKTKVKPKTKVKTKPKTKPTAKTAIKKITPAKASTSLVGKRVPTVVVENSKGASVSLKDFIGKTVVLYFYPKDDTPGCTVEGHEFSDEIF